MGIGIIRVRFWALLCLCVSALSLGGIAGCSGEPSRTGSASQSIQGGDTTLVTGSSSLPEAAVGRLFGATNCSASVIQRDVVLTAAHCVCQIPGIKTNPAAAAGISFSLTTGQMTPPITAKGFAWHGTESTCDGDSENLISDTGKTRDLAVLFLNRNLTVAELPGVLPVYTSGDFLDRIFNFPPPAPPDPQFFGGPLAVIGWGGGPSPNDDLQNRHKGTPGSPYFTFQCGFLGFDCEDGYTIEIDESGVAKPYVTDSGGPITFRENGVRDTEFGVFSTLDMDGDARWWSPTWDNGEGNGKWIRQFLDDADNDGVNDSVDNCNPKTAPACANDVAQCANPNQNETDGDGIGDACDNCPGFGNSAQIDSDMDGTGDACDPCPVNGGLGFGGDPDGDGIPSSCDNCPSTGNERPQCFVNDACPGSFCMPDLNLCATQVDTDGDDIGDECDTCPLLESSDLKANSNLVAEDREGATHQGDLCERVPQFIARSVKQSVLVGAGHGPPDPAAEPNVRNTVLLDATATFGRLPGASGAGVDTGPIPGQVGFRYCDCFDFATGQFDEKAQCLQQFGTCDTNPNQFDAPGSDWKPVTVGSTFGSFFTPLGPPKIADQPRGALLGRSYAGEIFTNTQVIYANPDEWEWKRIGRREMLAWRWAADLTSSGLGGAVEAHPFPAGGELHVGGIFWSHTLPGVASLRDAATQGRLRDHYTYSTSLDFSEVLVPAPDQQTECFGPDCGLVFDPNIYVIFANPAAPPQSFGLLDHLVYPAILVSGAPGQIKAVADVSHPTLDVTQFTSPTLIEMLGAGGFAWLSPVERSDRIRHQGYSTQAVAIAEPWRQTSPVVEVVLTREGALAVPSPSGGIACVAEEVLARCSGGLRCVVPCNGAVGDNPSRGFGPDASCVLEANRAVSDESPFTCETLAGTACPGGQIACSSACFVPCDGVVGCVPNGRFGDEQPALCGMADAGSAAALVQPSFNEPAFNQTPTSRFVPDDRIGSRALLSVGERSVFLIGGDREGEPNGEIWRYDLDTRGWERLLRDAESKPHKLLAAAYDYRFRRLLVLDELIPGDEPEPTDDFEWPDAAGGPPLAADAPAGKKSNKGSAGSKLAKLFKNKRRARLVAYDLSTGQSTLLATWPRVGAAERFALVARDDGSFVLLASRSKGGVTFALAGRAAPDLQWTGLRILPGKLVFQATLMERGVIVPLMHAGQLRVVELTQTNFFPPGGGMPEM